MTATTPATKRPEVEAMAPDLQLIRDLLDGTRAIQARAMTYLTRWEAEELPSFEKRSKIEAVFEGLGRILSASVGMLFGKPPTVTFGASETQVAAQWANIDMQGTAGPVFVKRFADRAVADGYGLILVDHPPRPTDVRVTAANEGALGLRPRWARYDRACVVSWRTEAVNNRLVLTQLVLAEPALEPDGEYGVKEVERYRVLRLETVGTARVAVWELHEKQQGASGTEFVITKNGVFRDHTGTAFDVLPIAIGYTGRTDKPLTARPPLLGVAWANLKHWQIATSLRWSSEISGFDTFVTIGQMANNPDGTPRPLKLGPQAHVAMTGDNAAAMWIAPTGGGTAALEVRKREAEQEMAALGLSFLARDKRAAETAEAKKLDATAENSTLATAAQGIEDAINEAWGFHARFMGLPASEAPTIALSKDFDTTGLEAPMAQAYAALSKVGFPKRPLVEAMQRGGLVGPDADVDELVAVWEAGEVASRDAQALIGQPPQGAAA